MRADIVLRRALALGVQEPEVVLGLGVALLGGEAIPPRLGVILRHAAARFWSEVSRGGVEYEDNHPTTVLDTFLKSVFEEKKKWDLNPANLYQASVFAWNPYRENKTITSVKYDTKKGLYTVAA